MGLFAEALQIVLRPSALLANAFGVAVGIVAGAIPGVNASMAMALILPFTWSMDVVHSLLMLAGVYCGGQFGGSITAILIGVPGTTSAAATVMDGYPMHKKGQSGKALGMALIASTIGGFVSAAVLIALAIPLAKVALAFGPAEYFGLAALGLTLIAFLSAQDVYKGLLSGLFGLLLSTVGIDPFAGVSRFSFGISNLAGGLDMIPVMMGLYAVSEVLEEIEKRTLRQRIDIRASTELPTANEVVRLLPLMIVCSLIGCWVGLMPGAGASIACWIAYNYARTVSKNGHLFGTGVIEGVASAECANNGVTGGAMVPLLALGIPGSNSTAVMLGALVLHGINPGPLVFRDTPLIPYSIFVGLFVANAFMFLFGLLLVKPSIKFVNAPESVLYSGILALVFTGAYTLTNDPWPIIVTLFFGVIGYFLRKHGFQPPAIVLGLVLGTIFETSLRRSLTLSNGSWSIFMTRPIAAVLSTATILSMVFFFGKRYLPKKSRA